MHQEQNHKQKSHFLRFWLHYIFILGEAVVILFFGLFTDYEELAGPKYAEEFDHESTEFVQRVYPLYQDVHVMVFIGFGFLMVFLKDYKWSSVGINFFLAAWTIQVAILCIGFWDKVFTGEWEEKIHLDTLKLVDADFAAASVLIAFGVVLGRLNVMQYMVMASIQTIIYALQMNLCFVEYVANDIGGSITIHMYGAFFGLTVALVIKRPDGFNHPKNKANYMSNTLAFIGTLFLWMYWPSFNSAFAEGNALHRSIINTLLSLTGATVMVFIITPFFRDGKLHMEDVLNATLSGGVIIGASANIIIYPWVSIFIGFFGGIISLVGFEVISPYLNRKIGLQDTCGVLSLHGIPGFLGGIISAVITGTASKDDFGMNFAAIFPKLKDSGRTVSEQGGWQLAAIATSLALAITTGLITGVILRCLGRMRSIYDDQSNWHFESEHEEKKEAPNANIKLNLQLVKQPLQTIETEPDAIKQQDIQDSTQILTKRGENEDNKS